MAFMAGESGLKNFRVLKNLGGNILEVRPYQNKDHSGYEVIYNEGDKCLHDPSQNYQTTIKYQCDDPDYKNDANNFPQVVTEENYKGVKQCAFNLIWKSRMACSICTTDQVVIKKGICNENSIADVHVTRKPDQHCVLDFAPSSQIGYEKDPFAGIYFIEGRAYVSKKSYQENCSILEDVQGHPILNIVLQIVVAVFIVLVICLAIIYCKYRKVSKKYLALTTIDNSETEINRPKTTHAGDEE